MKAMKDVSITLPGDDEDLDGYSGSDYSGSGDGRTSVYTSTPTVVDGIAKSRNQADDDDLVVGIIIPTTVVIIIVIAMSIICWRYKRSRKNVASPTAKVWSAKMTVPSPPSSPGPPTTQAPAPPTTAVEKRPAQYGCEDKLKEFHAEKFGEEVHFHFGETSENEYEKLPV